MTTPKNRSAKARAAKPADQIIDADMSGPPVAARAAVPPPPPPLPVIEDDPCAPPEPYDPADYRWVPVRRKARYDGWTEEKQRRFIEELADTGQVGLAAKAVGLSRAAAYTLRRAAHGAAFARAWDAAREQAGSFIEDVAFERAIEGVEHPVFDDCGQVVATRRIYNDRLLMFLLRSLKPQRYARHALASLAATIPDRPAEAVLGERLAALEPELPLPPEELLGAEAMEDELQIADIADGTLPKFLAEQRAELPQEMADYARRKAACDKVEAREKFTNEEFVDYCHHIDPSQRTERRRIRYR